MSSERRYPFGKHKGQRLGDIPTSYLVWALANVRRLDPGLRKAIEQELDGRNPAEPGAGRASRNGQPVAWERLIASWYRGLAKDYHPDRGGSIEVMQALNEAHKRLKELVADADGKAGDEQ
jgi:hypothetical protein